VGNLAAVWAGLPGHGIPSEKPCVDAEPALDGASTVEDMVAGERADLLAGLHTVAADGAGVAQAPPQGGDAAEPEEAHPRGPPPRSEVGGAHEDDEGNDDDHDQGDHGEDDAEHDADGDGHQPIIADVGGHLLPSLLFPFLASCLASPPLALSCSWLPFLFARVRVFARWWHGIAVSWVFVDEGGHWARLAD